MPIASHYCQFGTLETHVLVSVTWGGGSRRGEGLSLKLVKAPFTAIQGGRGLWYTAQAGAPPSLFLVWCTCVKLIRYW